MSYGMTRSLLIQIESASSFFSVGYLPIFSVGYLPIFYIVELYIHRIMKLNGRTAIAISAIGILSLSIFSASGISNIITFDSSRLQYAFAQSQSSIGANVSGSAEIVGNNSNTNASMNASASASTNNSANT